jgi:hypothetical protein
MLLSILLINQYEESHGRALNKARAKLRDQVHDGANASDLHFVSYN